jgi:SagB-type dehydrogenase family enzyme
LEILRESFAYVPRLLRHGAWLPDNTTAPQILIVLTARFQRMTWKYTVSAYATILKDTGALLQTMYLVATAMGLAPCAIGPGDSELFARAIGTEFHDETSVGELLLGTRPGSGGSL